MSALVRMHTRITSNNYTYCNTLAIMLPLVILHAMALPTLVTPINRYWVMQQLARMLWDTYVPKMMLWRLICTYVVTMILIGKCHWTSNTQLLIFFASNWQRLSGWNVLPLNTISCVLLFKWHFAITHQKDGQAGSHQKSISWYIAHH